MSKDIQQFVDDCRNHAKLKWVKQNLDSFPQSLREIVEDDNGSEVLKAGVGLFQYLANVVVDDFKEGMQAWSIIYEGYPVYPHTDLLVPYTDVVRTRQLWFNAAQHLNAPPIVKGEIFFNLYFRWCIAAFEFARKMLVFAAYCESRVAGQEFNIERYLFKSGDPQTRLVGNGQPQRANSVLKFYKSEFRHAIAHGNVTFAFPKLFIRLSNDDKNSLQQLEYDFSSEGDVPDAVVKRLQQDVDPMYQATRVFFTLETTLVQHHISTIKSFLPQRLMDPAVAASIEVGKQDPEGMRDWPST